MREKPLRQIYLACLILFCFVLSACSGNSSETPQNCAMTHRVIMQPVDHANPDGPKLPQHVDILVPKDAPANSPVFFNFGNETDLTDEYLLKFYRLHGERNDIIYIQAEHRGYGQSLTDDDQSVPSYIIIDQLLADTHEVITQLKEEFPGPWMAAGWSYGGGLVISFAHEYPDDVAVIMASSGVVDWPFLEYGYDRQVRETMGDACYERLAKHAKNLEPAELFDENWMEREFLQAVISGMTQFPHLKKLNPFFKLLTFLPTGALMPVLHRMDDLFGDGEAWRYARASGAETITREYLAEGIHNWHAWKYQMCAEIGGFIASKDPDGLYTRTQEDYCDECRAQFGEDPPYATAPEWSQREIVKSLSVPLVYVTGGMDPWLEVSLEPGYEIKNGKYFFAPDGRHCPERADPELARAVLEEMLKYARSEP